MQSWLRPIKVTANENTPATGAPTISGTLELGETLTIDPSGIADEDGMENAVLTYWLLGNYRDESSSATTAKSSGCVPLFLPSCG